MSYDAILEEILDREGWPKYTNNPDDRGGPTRGGITLETLRGWRKSRAVTASDVANLSKDEAKAIYRHRYIDGPGYDGIKDELLRRQVIDCGVLHGPGRASLWLQHAAIAEGAEIKADGAVGPKTLAAVNALDPHKLALRLSGQRIRFLGSIINSNYHARKAGRTRQDQASFALGWMRRATDFVDLEAGR